jgi:hypothetical protein
MSTLPFGQYGLSLHHGEGLCEVDGVVAGFLSMEQESMFWRPEVRILDAGQRILYRWLCDSQLGDDP